MPEGYDFDATFDSRFLYKDSTACDYYSCTTYSSAEIEGKGNFLPIGEFNIYVSGHTITSNLVNTNNTVVHIYDGNINNRFVGGTCTVNFEKLATMGGGSFYGNFKINSGSALARDPNIFSNLPSLTVKGNMDTVSKTVTMRIQGRVYF